MAYDRKYKDKSLEYAKNNFKRVPLDLAIEKYEEVKAAAGAAGEPVNLYIKKAIDSRLYGIPIEDVVIEKKKKGKKQQDDLKVEKSVVSTPGYDPSLEPTREPAEDIP